MAEPLFEVGRYNQGKLCLALKPFDSLPQRFRFASEHYEPGYAPPYKAEVIIEIAFDFLAFEAGNLSKTRAGLTEKIDAVVSGGKELDDETLEELEEVLISSDVGVQASAQIVEHLRERKDEVRGAASVQKFIRNEMASILGRSQPLVTFGEPPFVMLVLGVNGVGKTTTIGKLASRYVSEGMSVMLGAADTFRAAAIEQLDIWAERADADIIKHQSGSDP
ncbi:MAG: signal recognition particle receptor subunit alpha, partial [Nitrospirota bacterium]